METNVRFFKTISPAQVIWEKGKPTDKTQVFTAFINPAFIMHIDAFGDHCKITVQDALAKVYTDYRTAEVIAKLIENLK